MSAATNEPRRDSYVEKAYVEWERLSWAASDIPQGTDAHRDAEEATRAAFREFLEGQAVTPAGLLFKLDVALDFEDYTFVAIDDRNHYAAPAVLVSLAHDLRAMVLREMWLTPAMETTPTAKMVAGDLGIGGLRVVGE